MKIMKNGCADVPKRQLLLIKVLLFESRLHSHLDLPQMDRSNESWFRTGVGLYTLAEGFKTLTICLQRSEGDIFDPIK